MPSTFETTALAGVVIIVPKVFGDARGFLMETFKHSEFEAAGLTLTLVQRRNRQSGRNPTRALRASHACESRPLAIFSFVCSRTAS